MRWFSHKEGHHDCLEPSAGILHRVRLQLETQATTPRMLRVQYLLTIHNIAQQKDATIESKQAIIDQKQSLLDSLQKEYDRLAKHPEGSKRSSEDTNQNEMTVGFQIQNARNVTVEINPVCEISTTESFAGTQSFFGTEPFRLSPVGSTSPESAFSIPPNVSREFEVTIPDNNQDRILFARGAAVLNVKIYLLNGLQSTECQIPFNKDYLRSQKPTIVFR